MEVIKKKVREKNQIKKGGQNDEYSFKLKLPQKRYKK